MKKTILTLSLLASTVLTANDSYKTQVAFTAGYNKFDSASKMENAPLFGIRATVYENEVNMYGLQLGYEGSTGIKYENKKIKTDLHRVFTHLVIDGEEEYDITPYIFLGLGYEYLSDEIKGEPSQGFVDFGLGFKYFIDNNFNVLLETRAVGKFDTRDLDMTTNFGLGYLFGGKHHVKQTPKIVLDDKPKEDLRLQEQVQKLTPPRKLTVVKIPNNDMRWTQRQDELTDMRIDRENKLSSYHDSQANKMEVSYKQTDMASGDYYVQMAAYKKSSTRPFVAKLEEHGVVNTLVHESGDKKLVLVGPFSNRYEAKSMLEDLKTISRGAFIYKMR